MGQLRITGKIREVDGNISIGFTNASITLAGAEP
jgi:hypothetical protein